MNEVNYWEYVGVVPFNPNKLLFKRNSTALMDKLRRVSNN